MYHLPFTISSPRGVVRGGLGLCLFGALCATSCKESVAEGEYHNWQERNQHYVDSIASLAKQGVDGWTRLLGYYYQQAYADANPADNNIYVYVQKKANGTGTLKPIYTDSVRLHYRGRLIPSANHPEGYVFNQTYTSEEIQTTTAVPALLAVSQNIIGMCTVLQEMVEGDEVHMVVPYAIGYGSSTNSTGQIPGYSALIFDAKLIKVYRYKVDTNTIWR